jgi:hypothetical protein
LTGSACNHLVMKRSFSFFTLADTGDRESLPLLTFPSQ